VARPLSSHLVADHHPQSHFDRRRHLKLGLDDILVGDLMITIVRRLARGGGRSIDVRAATPLPWREAAPEGGMATTPQKTGAGSTTRRAARLPTQGELLTHTADS
jgi:hypothetical protein